MSVWNNALVAFSLVWILHGASLSISQPFSPLTDPSWSSSLPVDLLNLEDSGNFERNSVSAQTWVGRVFCCSALAKTQLLLVQPWRDTDNDNDYDNENDCDYAADWSSWWFWSDDDWDYQDGGSDRILGWYWSRWMKQWQYFTYSHPNQVLALAPLLLHISSQVPLLLTSKSWKGHYQQSFCNSKNLPLCQRWWCSALTHRLQSGWTVAWMFKFLGWNLVDGGGWVKIRHCSLILLNDEKYPVKT